jgi:hypothetical protein
MTTICELLGLDAAKRRRQLTTSVERAIARVPGLVAGPAVALQAYGAITGLLRVPVGTLALVAWDRHQRVLAACRSTADVPGAREVVALREHTITTTRRVDVELDVAGATRRLLELVLTVRIEVAAVELVVEEGRVSEARPGTARASAVLTADGFELARQTLRPVTLAGVRLPVAPALAA